MTDRVQTSLRALALWTIMTGGLMIVGSACSLTPTMPEPKAEQQLPTRYGGGLQVSGADTLLPETRVDTSREEAVRWWTGFSDSTLTTLIDTALVNNLDLVSARARLEELQAQYQIARSPLFPSVNASGSINRQSQPANTGIGGALRGAGGGDGSGGDGSGNGGEGDGNQPGGQNGGAPNGSAGNGGGSQAPDRFQFTTYSVTLGLSYELDFWGRVRAQKDAALNQFFASAADLQNARLAVIAQTITTYVQTAALEEQVRLTARNVDLLQDRLQITRDRYERGLATSFELYGIRQQLEQVRAQQPTLKSQLYDARTRLSVLLGRYAEEREEPLQFALPDSGAFGPVPAGMPAQLIEQRPDVMAAAARLEASRQQIGVARANLLPSFSLSGSSGLQSADLSNLFDIDQRVTNLVASLSAPLFQGGAMWAEVEASRARYRQQLAAYEQTLRTAYQEVKAALVAYQQERERFDRVRRQLEAARSSAETQQSRYEQGIGTYLAFLDAEQNLVQVRQRYVTSLQQLVQARLALHRALGGTWTSSSARDDPRIFH